MKCVDLFAGTGAFSYAFQSVGVEAVWANDMEPASKIIYDANVGNSSLRGIPPKISTPQRSLTHSLSLGNIHDFDEKDIPEFDILTGGFPCQPFSIAGKQLGFEDERSNVFWKILRIVDLHKPKIILLENVKNLVSHDEGKTFKTIYDNLSNKGYTITYKILDTAKITGIPQHRERIYIVCIRSNLYCMFTKQKQRQFATLLDFPDVPKRPLSEFLQNGNIAQKYYYDNSLKVWELVKNSVVKFDTMYQYRRVYVRENKSGECACLTANMGAGGHNVPLLRDAKGIRKLTPRECFNFQGFPSTYTLPNMRDSKLYKLAGNAVSFPVVKMIAQKIVALLK